MSDDDSDDLFGGGGSSDDTDELLATSKSSSKPIATKKKAGGRLKKKKDTSIPDADDGSDDDDEEENGLFDSDEEGKGEEKEKKKPTSSSTSPTTTTTTTTIKPTLTKRERMEALRAKKRAVVNNNEESSSTSDKKKSSKSRGEKGGDDDDEKRKGYESGDSYNSAQEYLRTKEDDDFIDTQGEDEELVREYYAEQHFDDERPDELEEMELKPRKKGRAGQAKKRGPDQLSAEDQKDKDNPICQAVQRMKKKKKVTKNFEELKESAVDFVGKMQNAAREDSMALREKKPGLKKLQMLPEVLDTMVKREMIRPLLESDFLHTVKTWIEPMKDGSLGNLTVRQSLIDGISKMNGENGIDNDDLKHSEFGKLIMTLYMHKKETPEMKRKLKSLIEHWSRRIFRKSGDMKNLGTSHAHRRSEAGLVGIAKAQAALSASSEARSAEGKREGGDKDKDLGSILSDGVKQARDLGRNRVRVPYSKGFQFTVRPDNKTGDVTDKKNRVKSGNDARGLLHKRMMGKKKK